MIEFSGVDLHDAIILEFVATSHANFLQNACLSLQLVNGKNAKLVFEDCFSVVVSFSQWIDGHDSINTWTFDMTQKQLEKTERFETYAHLDLKKGFRCFSATTNVTNSCIELVAKSILFTVE